jgi:hypothetical protein
MPTRADGRLEGVSARLGALAVVALVVVPAAAGDLRAPAISALSVTNGSAPYLGDGPMLATVSPNGDGHRDRALIRFRLEKPATVTVAVAAIGHRPRTVFDQKLRLGTGVHVVRWRPRSSLPARTYVVRLTARDRSGNTERLGFGRPTGTPVIRVLGIEAAFERESYPPSSVAGFRLESDEPDLTLEVLVVGAEPGAARATLNARLMTEAVPLSRAVRRDRSRRLRLWVGDWPSGLYVAKLTAPDGRSGYAPFVVRPRRLGEHRVAVILPTYTWQAYNFRDRDADGYGDTWYAGGTEQAALGRPYLDRGVPPWFRAYDLNFLRWLAGGARSGKDRGADFLADSDLARVRDARELARAYDLLVFPGHHEYVTRREYDLVRGFRDRGGNLMFLSANNFFWRVDRRGRTLTRIATWRELGRPEAAVLGAQYVASDRGWRKAPFVVRASRDAEWVFAGTGLEPGSRFGRFGIEIDRRTRHSPRGTVVLAEIPNLFGRGKTAEMTYYETPKSARVFAAGAFTLGGYAVYAPISTVLDNLWERLARP